MVTSARSTVWRGVDRRHVSAVRNKLRANGTVARAAKSRWRHRLLDPVLLGLGASLSFSCAEQPPPPPPVTAAIQPAPQPAPKVSPHIVPRPVRKPSPPQATESPTAQGLSPDASDEAVAMIPPEPPGPGGPRGCVPTSSSRCPSLASKRTDRARPAGGNASIRVRGRTNRGTTGDGMAIQNRDLRTRPVLLP